VNTDKRPVVVAFDGSPESEAGVRAGATLFAGHTLIVVTVWEPRLAFAVTPATGELLRLTSTTPNRDMPMVVRAQHEHAVDTALAGVELARKLGATAVTHTVPNDVDVPGTVASVADSFDAAAVVVGSRGLRSLKSRLFGSTSSELIHRTSRPVVVARAPDSGRRSRRRSRALVRARSRRRPRS
jgi:nucleotide-binding universal stress UspA family protein